MPAKMIATIDHTGINPEIFIFTPPPFGQPTPGPVITTSMRSMSPKVNVCHLVGGVPTIGFVPTPNIHSIAPFQTVSSTSGTVGLPGKDDEPFHLGIIRQGTPDAGMNVTGSTNTISGVRPAWIGKPNTIMSNR